MKGATAKPTGWVLRVAIASVWLGAASSSAQDAEAIAQGAAIAPSAERTAAERRGEPAAPEARGEIAAAARAFQDGQKAQLRGEHARAAELFELADALAPAPEALRSAIRNYDAAGQPARAASLALRAQARYPDDPATLRTAEELLVRRGPELARLRVRCAAPCSLLVDGEATALEPADDVDVFVPPGARVLEARFGAGSAVEHAVVLGAGEVRELSLAAPASAPAPVEPSARARVPSRPVPARAVLASDASDPSRARAADDGGLAPWVFITASALTATAGAAALVSGLDSLDKRDAYEADPTRERYERGVDSERRTNALLLATGGLALTSLVLLAFTDWDGGPDERAARRASLTPSFTPSFAVSPSAAHVMVRSHLP